MIQQLCRKQHLKPNYINIKTNGRRTRYNCVNNYLYCNLLSGLKFFWYEAVYRVPSVRLFCSCYLRAFFFFNVKLPPCLFLNVQGELVVQVRNIGFHFCVMYVPEVGRVAYSVQRLATGWTFRGSNPGWGEIFRTCPDRPWGPPRLGGPQRRCLRFGEQTNLFSPLGFESWSVPFVAQSLF